MANSSVQPAGRLGEGGAQGRGGDSAGGELALRSLARWPGSSRLGRGRRRWLRRARWVTGLLSLSPEGRSEGFVAYRSAYAASPAAGPSLAGGGPRHACRHVTPSAEAEGVMRVRRVTCWVGRTTASGRVVLGRGRYAALLLSGFPVGAPS